jgi:nucleoside-diphosphate-sugar epimerase
VLSKKQTIIILGHSGFIGSNLERLLEKSNNWSIIGRSLPDVDLTQAGQADLLIPFLESSRTLVLAAAVKRQFGDTLETFQANVEIVKNVCRLLESYPVKRVIFLSSAAVYGEETENISIDELTRVNPTSYYGISKYTAECLLKKTCANKTSLVCLRPPLVYGPNDPGQTYGPSGFSTAAKEGRPITLWGDGSELREFIFIDDLCRLIKLIADSEYEFEGEINAVSGTPYCFKDIVSILKSKFPNLAVDTRSRSREKVDNAFDASKIKSMLPPSFRFTPLKEGLDHLLDKQ